MLFYAIAEKDCIDCFYDFEINTYGDGISFNKLLPTKKLAEKLIENELTYDGEIIEVHLTVDEEGFFFEYENIWG